MTRDHYVAGMAPDWARSNFMAQPLVISPLRHGPMAIIRTLPSRQARNLKRRWFVYGCFASVAFMVVIRGCVHIAESLS